jgi:beta-lactamase class A
MIALQRRKVTALAVSGLAAQALASGARAQGVPGRASTPPAVVAAIKRFSELKVTNASCAVAAAAPSGGWFQGYKENDVLFVGSAIKTFILAQYLRGVEGDLANAEKKQLAIDDTIRSLSSSVFGDQSTDDPLVLAGRTRTRNVLEAMIAHSDNTATDAVMAVAGVANVRALIAEAKLATVQIPTSTRRLFIYLASGEDRDMSWNEVKALVARPTKPQSPLNSVQTMKSSASDMLAWYFAALSGKFFTKPETVVEFKRIQAMADALPKVVPRDTAAYGKGGSIEWNNFNCLSVPGQMIVRGAPVTFCFTVNWTGGPQTFGPIAAAFQDAVAAVLSESAKSV